MKRSITYGVSTSVSCIYVYETLPRKSNIVKDLDRVKAKLTFRPGNEVDLCLAECLRNFLKIEKVSFYSCTNLNISEILGIRLLVSLYLCRCSSSSKKIETLTSFVFYESSDEEIRYWYYQFNLKGKTKAARALKCLLLD